MCRAPAAVGCARCDGVERGLDGEFEELRINDVCRGQAAVGTTWLAGNERHPGVIPFYLKGYHAGHLAS
eukprot:COSAG04_NODE_713_length_10870_cov_3.260050_10_plen_69_part_00